MGRRRVVEQGMKVRNYSLKNWRVVGEYEADSGHTHTRDEGGKLYRGGESVWEDEQDEYGTFVFVLFLFI